MKEKGIWKILAILIVLVMVGSCVAIIASGITVSANTITRASEQTEDLNETTKPSFYSDRSISTGMHRLKEFNYTKHLNAKLVPLLQAQESNTKALSEEWNKTFGSYACDGAYSVIQSSDGGYVIAGYTYSYDAGGGDVWLVKTDCYGNEKWNKTFGGYDSDGAHSVIQALDGGYVIAGYTHSYSVGGGDAWLMKTDSHGNKEWDKAFGGYDSDIAYSLIQTSDGGYAIAGYTDSYDAGGGDAWLVKTDSHGNEEWNKTFGGYDWDTTFSLIQTLDGGYAMTGLTESYGTGSSDAWLVKIDSHGNEEWNETFGGYDRDGTHSVIQTLDGGYAITGVTRSYGAGEYDAWLVKTDSHGNEEWNKTFGGYDLDGADLIIQTSDGGYAITGYTRSYGTGSYDAWLVKTDSHGNEEWNKTFGGYASDSAHSVIQTLDGGYAIAGDTLSYGAGVFDAWLIKLAPRNVVIYVPDDYTKIQWAVDNASAGDTIIVKNGVYYENVKVNKRLTLRGVDTGRGKPVVHAGGGGGAKSAIKLSADGITLAGFYAVNSGFWGSGISVTSNNNTITNNTASYNYGCGIDLYHSINNIITNNTAYNNSAVNIFLSSSTNNIITNNTVYNSYSGGIRLFYHSNKNAITGNIIRNNGVGIGLYDYSSKNIITNNTVRNNNYGIYSDSSTNNKIYLNNFINNNDNVNSSSSTNIWNSPEKITYTHKGKTYENYLGNYWSDYFGGDVDKDGIGDTSYSINSEKDLYPLMEPYETYHIFRR